MSFKRHRAKAEDIKNPVIIEGDIVVHKDAIRDEQVKEIIETVKEVFPDAIAKEIKSHDLPELGPEKIKKVSKKSARKKRVDKKEYTNIGVIGDTVVCRDFRAIVKKKGLQINNVLTTVLHEWNTANYNL